LRRELAETKAHLQNARDSVTQLESLKSLLAATESELSFARRERDEAKDGRVADLQRELAETKAHLQTARDIAAWSHACGIKLQQFRNFAMAAVKGKKDLLQYASREMNGNEQLVCARKIGTRCKQMQRVLQNDIAAQFDYSQVWSKQFEAQRKKALQKRWRDLGLLIDQTFLDVAESPSIIKLYIMSYNVFICKSNKSSMKSTPNAVI